MLFVRASADMRAAANAHVLGLRVAGATPSNPYVVPLTAVLALLPEQHKDFLYLAGLRKLCCRCTAVSSGSSVLTSPQESHCQPVRHIQCDRQNVCGTKSLAVPVRSPGPRGQGGEATSPQTALA